MEKLSAGVRAAMLANVNGAINYPDLTCGDKMLAGYDASWPPMQNPEDKRRRWIRRRRRRVKRCF
jgi:hypothetical protein